MANFRGVDSSQKILAAVRNTFMLSTLLGLGFLLGFFPVVSANDIQQYLFVLVNAGAGKARYTIWICNFNVHSRMLYPDLSLGDQ